MMRTLCCSARCELLLQRGCPRWRANCQLFSPLARQRLRVGFSIPMPLGAVALSAQRMPSSCRRTADPRPHCATGSLETSSITSLAVAGGDVAVCWLGQTIGRLAAGHSSLDRRSPRLYRARRGRGRIFERAYVRQVGRTFSAWGPFWPWVMSNSTFWPSVSSR